MDSFELMTSLRNITGKHEEKELPTPELLRNLNLSNMLVCQLLFPFFKDDLIHTLTLASQSGDYVYPKDVLLFENVYRKDANSTFRLATKIELPHVPLIGTEQYPSNQLKPFYVQMGSKLTFTPVLSSTDIKLEYRRRMPNLVFGLGTSAADKTYITLDNYAPTQDDILNEYYLALYKYVTGDLRLSSVTQITDYVASTKRAVCTTLDADQEYYYALLPILPEEFHNYLISGGLYYLALSGFYDKDSMSLMDSLLSYIKTIYAAHGMTYFEEGKKSNVKSSR